MGIAPFDLNRRKTMAGNFCSHCGNAVSPMAAACPQCGHPVAGQQAAAPGVGGAQPQANPYAPVKSRVTAGILAILLGGIGVHKFYLNKAGLGVVYILLCWTYIPAIVALVEGIIYLTQTDQDFAVKQGVRVV
jgi:TM2 domain-containing membrane protein YozV